MTNDLEVVELKGNMYAGIADVHIKLSRFKDFEINRLNKLKETLIERGYKNLFIVGDFYDSSYPSLEEIKIGIEFLKSFDDVILISGNHEDYNKTTTLYDYIHLPSNVRVVKYAKLDLKSSYDVFLIDHLNLSLIKEIEVTKPSYLFSHYRSDIGFAPSEVDNELVSDKFIHTVLGDIHYRLFPAGNIEYISSPYNISFSEKAENGFMEIKFNKTGLKLKWIPLNLPNLIKLKLNTEQFDNLDSYISSDNLYSIELYKEPNLKDRKKVARYDNIKQLKFLKEHKIVKNVQNIEIKESIDNTSVKNTIIKAYSESNKEALVDIANKILDSI